MPSFVFCFRPDPGLRPAAIEELRARLPLGAVVTPKTQTIVAVDIPGVDAFVNVGELQREFGKAWEIHAATYAELRPPRVSLSALRKKLVR